ILCIELGLAKSSFQYFFIASTTLLSVGVVDALSRYIFFIKMNISSKKDIYNHIKKYIIDNMTFDTYTIAGVAIIILLLLFWIIRLEIKLRKLLGKRNGTLDDAIDTLRK